VPHVSILRHGFDEARISPAVSNWVILSPMTQGLIRYHHTGGFHFLTWSCYHRKPFLQTESAMNLFENSLETMRHRYGFVASGYVLMPEHIHPSVNEPKLLLRQKNTVGCPILSALFAERVGRIPQCFLAGSIGLLSKAIQAIKLSVSVQSNERSFW